jgi:hypothetical protein
LEGESEHLQLHRIQPGDTGETAVPGIVYDVLNSSGRPLDTDVKDFMELRFGKDFGQVRVHVDGRAADSAGAVNALAYTVGQDIVFGSGRYLPQTGEGRRLLAHELAHVAQQRPSRQTSHAMPMAAPRSVLMREPVPDNPTQSQGEGGQMGNTPADAVPEWVTEDLKRKVTAVVLAESGLEQEYDVMWIYLNNVTAAKGEAGLTKSSAYNGKGFRYRLFLYVLGDETYASDKLPAEDPNYKGYDTIADYCTNNRWFRDHGVERAKRLKFTVDELFTVPESTAYPGWTGQGSLEDFNRNGPKDIYWKRARAYCWLQVDGSVKDIYVKVLSPPTPDGLTTVIFHADAIKAYFDANPDKLPEVVPPCNRPCDCKRK